MGLPVYLDLDVHGRSPQSQTGSWRIAGRACARVTLASSASARVHFPLVLHWSAECLAQGSRLDHPGQFGVRRSRSQSRINEGLTRRGNLWSKNGVATQTSARRGFGPCHRAACGCGGGNRSAPLGRSEPRRRKRLAARARQDLIGLYPGCKFYTTNLQSKTNPLSIYKCPCPPQVV